MSAPVLTISEQKSAISGKKKKKKTVKNVLGIPDNLKVECCSVDLREVEKLQEILNRLLPSARLPVKHKEKIDNDSTEHDKGDLELRENAKSKRGQLSLGVNALNKSIKKKLISAVLLANDIQPKFLISHLNFLCDYNDIPFLYMPGLREITRINLGFPCIAVGFKTDASDFSEAVKEIKSIFDTKKPITQNKNQEIDIDSSESDETEIINDTIHLKTQETPFTYLYRKSVTERAFIPEKDGNKQSKMGIGDFIPVEKNIKEANFQKHSQRGISSNAVRKKKIKAKKLNELFTETDSDEELEVPKKKAKKDWFIDKRGEKKHCNYHPAKIFRIPSNPNRSRTENK